MFAATVVAVHDLSMHTMTTLWLVPVIPGTAAAAVTGAVSQAHNHPEQAVTLLYMGECDTDHNRV
jgi:hypothetical protein